MTEYARSADGTTLGYDRLGHGDPVILVAGLLCDRHRVADLATALSERGTVVNYDRRGRGDSSNSSPYAVEREVEDLAELIAVTGGRAAVYGHSSGAALALRAAAAGLPITRLVAHEPPFGPDDPDSRRAARRLAESVRAAIDDDRSADAIAAFYAEFGMAPEAIEAICRDPATITMAPTMVHDHHVMGDFDQGGTIPEDLMRAINVPTMVLAGAESPEFFRITAERLVELLPAGQLHVLDDADHGAPATVVAPVVADFLTNPA